MLRFILRSSLGAVFYRPWIDKITHKALERSLFPAARCWAAANGVSGDSAAFIAYLANLHPENRQILHKKQALFLKYFQEIMLAHTKVRKAQHHWEQLAFSQLDPDPEAVGNLEKTYLACERDWRAKAMKFVPFTWSGKLKVPQVHFEIPAIETVEQHYGEACQAPETAYLLESDIPDLEISHRGVMHHPDWGDVLGHSYWIRFPSPGPHIQDMAWARVMEPAHGICKGSLIIAQGIGQEADQQGRAIDPFIKLAAQGYRVIRLIAPWHGQRLPKGYFAGEKILAKAPMSALDFFGASVREIGYLTHWAKSQKDGPVALIGISLGALSIQLALTHCAHWRKTAQAQAAMLIVPGTPMKDITLYGKLARLVHLPEALKLHGWNGNTLEKWSCLTDPVDPLFIDPSKVIVKLGSHDDVTGYERGQVLCRNWQIPEENIFVGRHGHYTGSNSLERDDASLQQLLSIMTHL